MQTYLVIAMLHSIETVVGCSSRAAPRVITGGSGSSSRVEAWGWYAAAVGGGCWFWCKQQGCIHLSKGKQEGSTRNNNRQTKTLRNSLRGLDTRLCSATHAYMRCVICNATAYTSGWVKHTDSLHEKQKPAAVLLHVKHLLP